MKCENKRKRTNCNNIDVQMAIHRDKNYRHADTNAPHTAHYDKAKAIPMCKECRKANTGRVKLLEDDGIDPKGVE